MPLRLKMVDPLLDDSFEILEILMKKIFYVATSLALLTAISPAAASGDDVSCEPIKGVWMSKGEISAKAEDLGYDVRRVKTEDGCYELYVVDKDGKKAEIYMNPVSGDVVKTKIKS